MDKILEFLQKPEGAIMFMVLVVPGFVMLQTFAARIAGERLKTSEMVVDIIIYSSINDGLWALFLYFAGVKNISALPTLGVPTVKFALWVLNPAIMTLVNRLGYEVSSTTAVSAIGFVILIVAMVFTSPYLLARLYEWWRKRGSGPGRAIHPINKPWDWLFQERMGDVKQIVFTLEDGRRFGGYWQDPCFASSFPADEQIFISEVFNVDQSTGQFIDRIPDHCGILVDKSSVQLVEIYSGDRPLSPISATP